METIRRTLFKTAVVVPGVALLAAGLRWVKNHSPSLLRPPGSQGESAFLSACIRCNQCISVCPRDCLIPAGPENGALLLGTPHIVARRNPCDLCAGHEQMECIAVCPTSALLDTASRSDVRMGVAVIDPDICLPFLGISCKACWHACPFPNDAIRFDQKGLPIVVDEGCVGCGLCEHACLAEQAAIVVQPEVEA